MSDKRFYIVVPRKVSVPADAGTGPLARTIVMEHGRLLAQCIHLGRRIEANRIFLNPNEGVKDITTIVLQVPNSKALSHVWYDLIRLKSGQYDETPLYSYFDHNPEVYGTDERVLTAIGIGPVEKSVIEESIGHLELY